jgi:hypothetical protein
MVKTGAVAIAACAVCCAPLIAPSVLAVFAAGGASLAIAGEAVLALVIALTIGGYVVYRRHQTAKKPAAACACPPEDECNTGNRCTLPS